MATLGTLQSKHSTEDIAEYERRVEKLRGLMRHLGLDAIVVSDNRSSTEGQTGMGVLWGVRTPAYARYLSGCRLMAGGAGYPNSRNVGNLNPVVVVPLAGELTLVVPSGHLGSFAHQARAGSWIRKVVGTYSEDPAWEERTRWGLIPVELGSDMAQALKSSGLERARIGVSGTWFGIEETKSQLPQARFEPTVVMDAKGRPKDLLEPLIGANSPWEISRLMRAQAAADVTIKTFIGHANAGATVREATLEAQFSGEKLGTDWLQLVGSPSVEPWTWSAWPYGAPDGPFEKGKMYTLEISRCAVDGYTVQSVRSFVVGTPTSAQVRVFEAAKRSLKAMLDCIEIGTTGDKLFEVGIQPVRAAGLDPWARFGHLMGYEFDGPERLSLVPGNEWGLYESQAFIVHPAPFDKATGIVGCIGDTLLMENGRWRHLSVKPPVYELTSS